MQYTIFSGLIFLTPIFFLTFTSNFFSTPKQLLLILAVLILLIYHTYQTFISKTIKFSSSRLTYGLAAFSFAIVANIVFHPLSRLEAAAGPAALYLSLSALSYLISLEPSPKLKKQIIFAFISSTIILALHTLAQLTFLYKSPQIPLYMQTRGFTLTGNVLTSFIVLFFGSILSGYFSLKSTSNKIFYLTSTMLTLIAAIALGAIIVPGGELALTLLPIKASWSIALDAMKSPSSFILGTGLINFPIFYNSVKPLFLNSTAFWNTVPGSASSELLHIMTTAGMLGILSFLSIPFFASKNAKSSDLNTQGVQILAVLSFISLALTPASIPILLIFFVSVGLLSAREPNQKHLNGPINIILSLGVFSVIGLISFYSSKLVMAETSIRKAQVALTTNDGKTLYENSLRAVELAPSMASYRLSYSQVNLSLATALSQKESLSDTEKSNVSQLIAQSVREGKAAVSLNPNNSIAWQNLGNIYQKLINVGQGADKFALESYAKAVSLDPANPALRIEYGGLLYQLAGLAKDKNDQSTLYSLAQNEFQTAIQLKPDYPNAYYNLAKLLETVKDYSNSFTVMQKAISLLGPDNPNLGKANAELETIKSKIPKPTPSPSPTPTPDVVMTNPEKDISTPAPLPPSPQEELIEIPPAPNL